MTWLNSSSSPQTDTEIKNHPTQHFRIKSLRLKESKPKKAGLKDTANCKSALET